MKEKVNIIQFMPYFPPHKGGLETVGEEIGKYWVKNELGECINIVFDVGQVEKNNYVRDGYKVILIPSFDIISNFPVPKFWKREFWNSFKELKRITSPQPSPSSGMTRGLPCQDKEQEQNWVVITHTRFFLSSFIGGIFARKNKLKWIHIEHGSDYVKLSSKIKSFISFIYDKIIGKWVFKKANKVLAISGACKKFINKEFVKREVEVFYRGVDVCENIQILEDLNEKFKGKKIIGYIGRLYKWKNVEGLIRSYYLLDTDIQKKLQLVIVGDGEDLDRLKSIDIDKKIYFTGGKDFIEALSYQKKFDIHVHPSSPGGGLATTLLQAMIFGCLIVATPNEGADEVIINNKNGFLLKNDNIDEIKKGILLAVNNLDKRLEFSLENKKIIDENFKWDKNIMKLYSLIK